MKNKFLTAVLGTAMVMTVVTGCSQQDAEVETQTLEIAAIETVSETESQSDEMEFMELDLAELQETSAIAAEVSTGDLIESEDMTETAAAETVSGTNTRKPGEAESETELQEKETGKVQKETRKNENTIKESAKSDESQSEQDTKAAASEQTKQDQESTEVFNQIETETIVQRQETVPKAETEQFTKTEIEQVTETETEQITETETEQIIEAETELFTETETEQTTEAETELLTETETEQITETETELFTEAETEQTTEAETELFTETETEQITEAETELLTEAETEQKIYMTVNNRVNVRREASTGSDTLDLLIPGSLFELSEEMGEWSRICYTAEESEIDGYIKTEFMISAEAVYVPLEKVNVRKEASVDAEKLGQLTEEDRVVVLNVDLDDETADAGLTENTDEQSDTAELPEWFEICYSNDGKLVEGYVKAEFLKQIDLEDLLKETELVGQSETEPSTETASTDIKNETSDTETEAEIETETEVQETMLSYGIKGQLELLQLLFPNRTNVGIIYSSKDKGAMVQLAEYETLADTYGLEIHKAEIIDELDIDLAASVLVESVDCIICLDDQVVNELTQTICAYAGEVEIPVIGISKEQTDMGCAASYDGTTVFWNEAAAAKFGLSSDQLHLVNEVICLF